MHVIKCLITCSSISNRHTFSYGVYIETFLVYQTHFIFYSESPAFSILKNNLLNLWINACIYIKVSINCYNSKNPSFIIYAGYRTFIKCTLIQHLTVAIQAWFCNSLDNPVCRPEPNITYYSFQNFPKVTFIIIVFYILESSLIRFCTYRYGPLIFR